MDEYNPYKNMTLRQELEARFDEVDRKQKEQDALDYIRNNMQFSPNNAGNINTDQQPTGWSDQTNINPSFGGANADTLKNTSDYLHPYTPKPTMWENVKDVANAALPYIPTYPLEYGMAVAQNTLPQIKDTISDAYNIYKKGGLYALGKQYAEPSVKQAIQAKDEITPLNISDINKHQYISCVGATGGPLAAIETLGGGMYKEVQDTKDKLTNSNKREAYGGVSGVLEDAWKDLKNDVFGGVTGYIAGKQGIPWLCELLRYFPINPKW